MSELDPIDYDEENLDRFDASFKKKKFRIQKYKGLLEAKPGPHDFVMVLDNMKPSFNIGKIFRSTETFGGREIHVLGNEYFDPCPAKGTLRHIPTHFQKDFSPAYDKLTAEGYTIFLMDPRQGEPLPRIKLPKKSAFVVGHEQYGISFDPAQFAGLRYLKIPQFGKTQSLNASVAASIVIYEYLRQWAFTQ